MFPHQYQPRGFPARHQPQQSYSELEAYAEDLEYRAALARQAARRPAPRRYQREDAYAPAPIYERSPRYQRPVYREPVYVPREAEYRSYQTDYYGDYSPAPVYVEAPYEYDDAYAYDYPQPARPSPRPVSYGAPPPALRRAAAPEYIDPPVEAAPRARQVAPQPQIIKAPTRPPTPPPQEDKLDQIIAILKDTVKQKERSTPAPAAHGSKTLTRLQSQHGLPAELESVLDQDITDGRPERATPPPRPRTPEPQATTALDISGLQNLLGRLFGGTEPEQQPARRAPVQQPRPAEASQLDALLGQIMGAIGQAPQSADPELPIVPDPALVASKLPAQPKTKPFPEVQAPAPAAPADPSKPTYTFALPASAQPNAIPRRASRPAVPPTASDRSSAHIPPNPNDAGRFNVRPGAADEVADIREAIRRSLDRLEDVKAEAPKATTPSAGEDTPVEPEVPSTAMDAIRAIESRFVDLTSGFKFPDNPDFSPSASSASSALLFTHTNAPVRTYEQALSSLLTDLDAVDSQGDDEVRHARKELVNRVEAALESLDAVKAAAWARSKGEEVPAPAPEAVPAEAEAEEEEEYIFPETPVNAEDPVSAEPAQMESAPVEEAPIAAAEVVVADEVEAQTQPDGIHPTTESEVASVSDTSEVGKPATAAPADAPRDIHGDPSFYFFY